jgi:hypothetical protein
MRNSDIKLNNELAWGNCLNKQEQKRIARVIANYDSAYPDPFFAKTGDKLTIIPKDSPWPGWLWCTDSHGESRWLPQSYLDIKGDIGTLLYDYSAVELTIRIDEQLTIIKEAEGWYWCTNGKGQTGWAPGECVKIIE